jgi:hypothetical protein
MAVQDILYVPNPPKRTRLRLAAITSGTFTTFWQLRRGAAVHAVKQGSGFGPNSRWACTVTDGTNTGAVKAASTAPVAADPALVVAISPNAGAKVTDGTNIAAVKAASTPAAVADPALVVQISPGGVLSISATSSAATTNATSVKASAGTLFSFAVSNVNAAARFLKFYNKASAPTVGTDIPILVVPVAANGMQWGSFADLGMRFSTGIAFAITGAGADSDATAVAAGDVKVVLNYV